MVLVGVMALVKNDQVDFFHFCKSVHEQIVKLFGHRNEDVVFVKLFTPCLKLGVVLAAPFLPSQVSSDDQVCVALDSSRLLLD